MFLLAELSVEEYVSQMTTLAIIATVLGVIGVCLLIFAFILKDRRAKQAAVADTAEQPESDEALSSETELSAEILLRRKRQCYQDTDLGAYFIS